MARATKLGIEFGEDPNLEKWQLLLAAYRNVTTLNDKLKDASQEAKLWTEDKEYRARMMMQQLRGEPLMLKDDTQVITALEDPFLIVRNLIVPFIGGVDFQSQLGKQTWDWENRTLLVCGRKLRLESMHCNSSSIDSPRKPIQSCWVILANDVRVQPGEEALVPCSLKRAVPNTECLQEPQRQQDEYPIRAMYCLIRPADESATI